jgi:hypothetical protein
LVLRKLAHDLVRLDPQTAKITQVHIESPNPINAGGFSNFGLTPDGFIWTNQASQVQKLDPETAKVHRPIFVDRASVEAGLRYMDGHDQGVDFILGAPGLGDADQDAILGENAAK